MKKLLLVFAISTIATYVSAQEKRDKPILISVGVEGSLPIGDFGDFYSFGIGGSLQGEYKAARELGITLNAGYLNYTGKTVAGTKIPSSGLVPVLAGAKYYLGGGAYAHGQLGVAISTEKGGGSNFMYTPGLGYLFAPGFDAEIKYVGISNGEGSGSSNSIGLRLAYNF